MRGRASQVVLAVVAAVLCVGAAPAGADSFTYIGSDGNVWLSHANGSGRVRVTHDGSREKYSSPSESPGGTILVETNRNYAHGSADILRLSQSGQVRTSYTVSEPSATSTPSSPPEDPLLSPDGSKVAWYYYYDTTVCLDFCQQLLTSFTQVFDSDRNHPVAEPGSDLIQPSWMGPHRVLVASSSAFDTSSPLEYFDLRSGRTKRWFSADDVFGANAGVKFEYEHAISRDGRRLAVEYWNGQHYGIALFRVSGAFNGNPPGYALAGCAYAAPPARPGHPAPSLESLSWAPDGHAIAFEIGGSLGVMSLPTMTSCAGVRTHQVVRNVTDPYWSSANIKRR